MKYIRYCKLLDAKVETVINSASDVKRYYKMYNPDGHFFDRETMRFFGDTMKNFGFYEEDNYIVLYRKKKVKNTSRALFFFHKQDFSYHCLTS